MALHYTLGLRPNRLDHLVMSLFRAPGATRLTRDNVLSDVHEGKLDHMLLLGIEGLEALPRDLCDRAAINIVNFHFEALVLRNMGVAQLANYCGDVEKTLCVESLCPIDRQAPLWISTVHHACVFPVLAQLSIQLVKNQGYRNVVFIHKGDRLETRLELMGKSIGHESGVRPEFLKMRGAWLPALSRLSSPDSVIFYFADMPHAVSKSRVQKNYRKAGVELFAANHKSIKVETLSGGDTFARRLGAFHTVLEYPRPDRLRLRKYASDNPVALCQLEDWIFWPALTVVPEPAAVS